MKKAATPGKNDAGREQQIRRNSRRLRLFASGGYTGFFKKRQVRFLLHSAGGLGLRNR